jgi:TetR/AcrR family transcriptional regulator
VPDQPKPRRSPTGGERQRDAERTRERILDAALVEFGEHGYAGARISAIAGRAGVNQQLISYYFDGKEGLFRALTERWRAISGDLSRPESPLDEVVAAFSDIGESQRHWARLLIWQALADDHQDGEQVYRRSMVDDLRRRQAAGEIAPDLDPAYLQLTLFGAALAPTLLARFAEDFTGRKPDSPEFLTEYRRQLKLLIAHLAKPV